MTRQPKTPRTIRHQVRYWLHPDSFYAWYGHYRRQPKGRRAKSGQWWRREHQPSTRSWAQAIDADLDRCMTVIDEHSDSRRVMEALEKWPAGRTSAATDTTIMEALDSHRRTNA